MCDARASCVQAMPVVAAAAVKGIHCIAFAVLHVSNSALVETVLHNCFVAHAVMVPECQTENDECLECSCLGSMVSCQCNAPCCKDTRWRRLRQTLLQHCKPKYIFHHSLLLLLLLLLLQCLPRSLSMLPCWSACASLSA
jgi:hypothetical protein